MNILIVVAVLVVFGVLRFLKANLLMWGLAWWVGIYVLLRFGFSAPIPSSVVSLYMGIITIAILAYMTSSQERRDEVSGPLVRFMTEKRYAVLLAVTVVALPVLAAANVYMQMNVPLEPPFFPRTVHPASPSEITVHDKKIDIDAGDNPFRELERSNPEEFRKHVENGTRRSTTATASSATATTCPATACSCTGSIRFRPTSRTATRSRIFARRFCSGASPREARDFPKKGGRGTRPCPRGRRS